MLILAESGVLKTIDISHKNDVVIVFDHCVLTMCIGYGSVVIQ
ncbi:hypothetical protein HMPREF1861_00912 [Corynebacterium kroppenstedtii]|nr:hypothetical protein HMPREF1861_00912 [Corynebacterium kroppenstedtii]